MSMNEPFARGIVRGVLRTGFALAFAAAITFVSYLALMAALELII